MQCENRMLRKLLTEIQCFGAFCCELDLIDLVCLVEIDNQKPIGCLVSIPVSISQFYITQPFEQAVPCGAHNGYTEFSFEFFPYLYIVTSCIEIDIFVFKGDKAAAFRSIVF